MAIDSKEIPTELESRKIAGDVCSGGGSLPMILSGLAVLLAALALIANLWGQPTAQVDPVEAVNAKLGQIEARIGDVESQISNDKMDGVNMQMKRILLELEQLAVIADDATRSKIDQAYLLLKPLTEPAMQTKAEVDEQSTSAPENQSDVPAAEQSAEQETPQETVPVVQDNATETSSEPVTASEPDANATPDEAPEMQPGVNPQNQRATPSEAAPETPAQL